MSDEEVVRVEVKNLIKSRKGDSYKTMVQPIYTMSCFKLLMVGPISRGKEDSLKKLGVSVQYEDKWRTRL